MKATQSAKFKLIKEAIFFFAARKKAQKEFYKFYRKYCTEALFKGALFIFSWEKINFSVQYWLSYFLIKLEILCGGELEILKTCVLKNKTM